MSLRQAAQQFLTGSSPFAILSEVQPTLSGNILVLDSSFNPPHETHLALITRSLHLLNTRSTHKANISRVILLHALNNADKLATSSLSALMPRLSLMDAFSRDVADCINNNKSSSEPPVSVLLALTTAAKFADKATLLRTTNALSASQSVFWILGMDTVVRLFDSKYYTIPVMDALTPLFRNDAVVFAPRAGFILPEEQARGFLERGKIVCISEWDQEELKCSYSSTHVRNLLARLESVDEVERVDAMTFLQACVPKHTLQRLLEIQKDAQQQESS
ncbi:hypothetical protein BJ741DRAFT_86223 [Chytriomyces cf. hyalinus JEL632]|nr:hypothetical protein BJ741DRAFT_86223 [Chytriomyces cf. hyalinus JEL632]